MQTTIEPGRVCFLFSQEPDPDCLDESEIRRLAQFGSESRRAQFVLGRTALRTLVGKIMDVPAREIPLGLRPSGAPFLVGEGLRLSLSHSGGGALAAAALGPVGCDLEAPSGRDRDALMVADRFFSPQERQELRDCPQQLRQKLFLGMWNRKEAVFKCGVLDWTACMVHPWREGENPLEGGSMLLSQPRGLPPGWHASLAQWMPQG
jgi:phosphopantetheinyl transferase